MFVATDLHGHTFYSDGRATPEEYVEFRRQLGMKAIVIADHDVLAGVRAGAAAASRAGMQLLPALEVTSHLHYGASDEVTYVYGTTTGYAFTAKNSTDEYVRAAEKMTFNLPAHFLWSSLYPGEQLPSDPARLKQLSATVTVSYFKAGASFGTATVATTIWSGTQAYDLKSATESFSVDGGAESMHFSLAIHDGGASPPVSKTLADGAFLAQPVIGGALPNKTALFDSNGAAMRSRVLEGGNPVAGASLAVAYTDWRAATLIDSTSIDQNIGTETSYSRFGPIAIPVNGNLEYDITYKLTVDGQTQDAQPLSADSASKLLPAGRTAYEASVSVPGSAKNVSIAFHIKAYLKADYTSHPNMTEKKYADGQRVLVREHDDASTSSFSTASN